MILTKRLKYLSLSLSGKRFLISELRTMRESLRNKPKVKRKTTKKRKSRKPTLLSDRALKMFDKMTPEMKEFVLYGDKK